MIRYLATFIVVSACLLLFVYTKFLEHPKKSDGVTSLYILPRDTLVTIHLTEGKKGMMLEKKEGGWWIHTQKASESKVDESKVDLFVADFGAPEVTSLTATPHEPLPTPESVGLEPPQKGVELVTNSGLTKTLLIGKPAPVGGNTFVKLKERADLYLMPSYRLNFSLDPKMWQQTKE